MVPRILRLTPLLVLGALGVPAVAQPWRPTARPPATLRSSVLLLDEHPATGRVLLRLRSPARPQHVVIEARATATSSAQPGPILRAAGACNTPCQLWVPPGLLRLRATAPGLRATDLDVDVDAATALDLRAPSNSLFNIGTGLTALGATIMLVTASVALAQQIEGVAAADQLRPPVAIGLSLLGALLLGGGIPLLVTNRTGYGRSSLPLP